MTFADYLRTNKPLTTERELAARIGIPLAQWQAMLGAPARGKDGRPTTYPVKLLCDISHGFRVSKEEVIAAHDQAVAEASECEPGEEPGAFWE